MTDTPLPSARPEADIPAAVRQVVAFFEHLTPGDLPRLSSLYAPQAHFKDPFNEVQGLPAIEAIFRHMFKALDTPHFVVTTQVVQGHQCFLVWDFRFRFHNRSARAEAEPWQTVRGSTHLVFDT